MTQVSELLTEKIKGALLACDNLVLRANAELGKLVAAKDALIEDARTSVQAPKDHLFDTDARTFVPRQAPKPFSAPRTRQAKRAKP